MKEIYKDIPGYENKYQVSNWGNVKSLNYNHTGKERLLEGCSDGRGYLKVGLYKNNKTKKYRIHKLVAMAFLGHTPCGFKIVVDHIDNNGLNNRLDNLQLITQRENNSKDKIDVGITLDKSRNKWKSQIEIKDLNVFLGRFTNKQDGLNQYQKALANIDKYDNPKQFREYLKKL